MLILWGQYRLLEGESTLSKSSRDLTHLVDEEKVAPIRGIGGDHFMLAEFADKLTAYGNAVLGWSATDDAAMLISWCHPELPRILPTLI